MKRRRNWSLQVKLLVMIIFLVFFAIGCSRSSSQKSQGSSPTPTSPTPSTARGTSMPPQFTSWPLKNHPTQLSSDLARSIFASPIRHEMIFGMGNITALALSPDSSVVAVGTEDGEIAFLDAGSGTVLRVFEAHRSKIVGGSFLGPEYFVSIAADASVKKWKLPECLIVKSLEPNTLTSGSVLEAVFSKNGAHLMAVATDRCLYCIDTSDLSIAHTLCNVSPRLLAVSADGRYIACYDSLENFIIYDSHEKKPILCFLPGREKDAFAFDAKGIPTPIITNVRTKLDKKEFAVTAIKIPGDIFVSRIKTFPSSGFTSNESAFTCVYKQNSILYFVEVNYLDLSWKILKVDLSPFKYYSICGISIAPSGSIAAVLPEGCNTVIPVTLRQKEAGVHVKLGEVARFFLWVNENEFIVSNERLICRYHLNNKLIWETQLSYFLLSWNLSPTGRYVAIVHDKGVTLWDSTTREPRWTLSRNSELDFYDAAFYKNVIPLFSPNEDVVILFNSGGKSKGVLFLSTSTGEFLRHIQLDAEIYSWTISANGERLFLGLNGRIIVLNIRTAAQQTVALPMQGKIVQIAKDAADKVLFGVAESNYRASYVFALNANTLQVLGGLQINEDLLRVYYYHDNIIAVTKDRRAITINPNDIGKVGSEDRIRIFLDGIEVVDSLFTDYYPLKDDWMVYIGSGYAIVDANTKEIKYADPVPVRSDVTVRDYSGRVVLSTPKYEFKGPSPSQLRLSSDCSLFGVVINKKVFVCKTEDLIKIPG